MLVYTIKVWLSKSKLEPIDSSFIKLVYNKHSQAEQVYRLINAMEIFKENLKSEKIKSIHDYLIRKHKINLSEELGSLFVMNVSMYEDVKEV